MPLTGILTKMITRQDRPVRYALRLGHHSIPLNPLVGASMLLQHDGEIQCLHCHRSIKKTFRQGYCYPCSQRLAACDICIVKPELCHFDRGTCREPAWGQRHCMQAHVVYLANASAVKVGITRAGQIPGRWIDQGASEALAVLEVQSRHHAGLIEVALAKHVTDRTNWRAMLKGPPANADLVAARDRLLADCGDELRAIAERFGKGSSRLLQGAEPVPIEYPVLEYPAKVQALGFDKSARVQGRLMGIKGQYLLFDSGVLNVRKYTAYQVSFSANSYP